MTTRFQHHDTNGDGLWDEAEAGNHNAEHLDENLANYHACIAELFPDATGSQKRRLHSTFPASSVQAPQKYGRMYG